MTISVKTFIGVSLNEHSGVMLPLDEARELRDALSEALYPFSDTARDLQTRGLASMVMIPEPEPCIPVPCDASLEPVPSVTSMIGENVAGLALWEDRLLDDWFRLRAKYHSDTDAAIVGRMVGAFVKSRLPELKGMLSEDIRQNLRRLGVTVADPMPRNERGSIGGQKFRQMCAETKPEPSEPEPEDEPGGPTIAISEAELDDPNFDVMGAINQRIVDGLRAKNEPPAPRPTVAQMIADAPTAIPGKLTESIQALKCLASDGWTPGRIAQDLYIDVGLVCALAARSEDWLADYRRLSMGDKNDVMAGVLKRWKGEAK